MTLLELMIDAAMDGDHHACALAHIDATATVLADLMVHPDGTVAFA